jgi:cytidylate kinase
MKTILTIMLLSLIGAVASAQSSVSNLIAQAAPSVTNLVSVPMEEAVKRLEVKAKAEWQSVESEIKAQLDATQKRLQQLRAEQPEDKKNILSPEMETLVSEFTAFKKAKQEELKQIRRMHRARIEALQKLKTGNAEPNMGQVSSEPAPSAAPDEPSM